MEKTTIYEAVVLFDLSKNDLRKIKTLILNYDGNNFSLEQNALLINPILKKDNLIFIIKSFVNADMFIKQGNAIIKIMSQKISVQRRDNRIDSRKRTRLYLSIC